MSKTRVGITAVAIFGLAIALSACTGKTDTNTAPANTNVVVTEAPFTFENGMKVFALKLVNGLMNYKTMTFYAGDRVEVRLTSDDQPVNFKFQEVPDAASVNGVFSTNIQSDDKGGTYRLICADRECGSITLTVVPGANANASAGNANAPTNTNTVTNSSGADSVTKVELQRIPAGTGFTPTNTYETTTNFRLGDQFGLSVTGDFTVGAKLAHTFTNSAGSTVGAQTTHPDLRGGTNGSCCYSLPTTAGSYTLKVFVNGVVAQSVPITVR